MGFVILIVALVVGELVMWELPQYLASRVRLRVGIYVCLSTSLIVVGIAYVLLGTVRPLSADALLIGLALFAIMAVAASAALWHEQKKLSGR